MVAWDADALGHLVDIPYVLLSPYLFATSLPSIPYLSLICLRDNLRLAWPMHPP